MEVHHCLGFRSPYGAALRHVAELPVEEWGVAELALQGVQGWSAGALAGLVAGAAVLAPAPDRQQHVVSVMSITLGCPMPPPWFGAPQSGRGIGLAIQGDGRWRG